MTDYNGENVMSSSGATSQPTIARIWRGRTISETADEYARYLYENGIRPLEEKALGVQMFREDREGESEFVTISYWESVDAMSRFTGGDPNRIHHLDRDPEFLIELPESVQVLDIVAQQRPLQRGHLVAGRRTGNARSSAPGAPGAIPGPRQALGDQHVAHRAAVAFDDSELPPVPVHVPAAADHLERPGVHEFQKPSRRPIAARRLRSASRAEDLGCIDVLEPDLDSPVADGVAVDHAVRQARPSAQHEGALPVRHEPAVPVHDVRVQLGREPKGGSHADQRRQRRPWRAPQPPSPTRDLGPFLPLAFESDAMVFESDDFAQCTYSIPSCCRIETMQFILG
jgi:hypothetical protein